MKYLTVNSKYNKDIFFKPSEHEIQDDIRNTLKYFPELNIFRANVGAGWFGQYYRQPKGGVYLPNPRWITTGVPKGFPDLFGYKIISITPDMVGKQFAQFAFIEVKKSTKSKVSDEQKDMMRQFLHDGALGGIAHNSAEALINLGYPPDSPQVIMLSV